MSEENTQNKENNKTLENEIQENSKNIKDVLEKKEVKTTKAKRKDKETKTSKTQKENKEAKTSKTQKENKETKTSKIQKEDEEIKTENTEESKNETIEPNIEKVEENIQNINKENKEKTQKPKSKKTVIPIIAGTILICLIILLSVIFALININNNKIMSGISIMGIDVSNLSKEDTIKKLEDLSNNKIAEDITLKKDEFETTINGKQFNCKYDIEKAVNEAYNIGRQGNIITNNYAILFTQLFKKEIPLQIHYDQESLDKKVEDISSKMPTAVKQSSYYIEDEKVIIVKGTAGTKIKDIKLKSDIINELEKIGQKSNIIEIQTETVEPDEINVEKIRNEIYKEPQDAYVSKNPTVVHPHVNGVDFKISIEEAQKIVQEEKEEYEIPLKITIAKTIEQLGEEAFPDELAIYTTRYDPTNTNRSTNLSLAAQKINGTVIMPGETFSYNKIVGVRTISAGYKPAGAFAGGKVVQDVGGGICQISSTLYNTVLLANLEITDRSNHAFLTGYVEPSRDATVSWGSLDFKFKNTRTYPIKVNASAKDGVCKISIHGIKEETEYEVVIQSKTLSHIPYTVKYIEDKTLEKGKEIVEQSGQNGCKSEAYRILKLNGKIVSKTLISKDTYDPMQRIVRKGIKE